MKIKKKVGRDEPSVRGAMKAGLLCQHSFDGIGITDLTKSAGLTDGGFYANFGLKELLVGSACAQAEVEAGEFPALFV